MILITCLYNKIIESYCSGAYYESLYTLKQTWIEVYTSNVIIKHLGYWTSMFFYYYYNDEGEYDSIQTHIRFKDDTQYFHVSL